MRVGIALIVAVTGCAQVLGIHDRGGDGSGSGSGSNGSNCTSDYLDVAPMLAISAAPARTDMPSMAMAALGSGAATPELGVTWCEATGLKFATLGLDGTPGPVIPLGSQCYDGYASPVTVGATDSSFAAAGPGSTTVNLYVLDTAGAAIGSPILASWDQAIVRGWSGGFVILALTVGMNHLIAETLANGATALGAAQMLPSDASCCSFEEFDGVFDKAGDLVAGWSTNAAGLWQTDHLAAPTFTPGAQTALPGIHGSPRLASTSLGVMYASSANGYQFITNSGGIGPLLPPPDAIQSDCNIAATADQIRIARPDQGVVSWHALDPSTGAGPELLSIATGGTVHTVVSDNQHGFAIAWPVAGGIGYAHVELCTQ